MSQSATLILLPQTAYRGTPTPNTTVVGSKQPGASYYLSSQDLQTVTWAITNFKGTITIQASLLDSPSDSDSDWFTVQNLVYNDQAGTTVNSFNNVTGNFVWLRAVINNFTQGVVQNIKVSY